MDNIKELKARFKDEYGVLPTIIAAAPGRLEILGNHTDYNEGYVLSTATDLSTFFAIVPVEGDVCTLNSFDTNLTAKFKLEDIATPIVGDWSNYIKGGYA